MDFHMKLPRNKKEFIIFLLIISVISVNIIAPLISFVETNFNVDAMLHAYTIVPYIWISVIIVVLITYVPAEFLTKKFVNHGDSFSATITINVLCSVFIMSLFLTILGTWIGTSQIKIIPLIDFINKWPRNFMIAFIIELLIAQPLARLAMHKFHLFIDNNEIN